MDSPRLDKEGTPASARKAVLDSDAFFLEHGLKVARQQEETHPQIWLLPQKVSVSHFPLERQFCPPKVNRPYTKGGEGRRAECLHVFSNKSLNGVHSYLAHKKRPPP